MLVKVNHHSTRLQRGRRDCIDAESMRTVRAVHSLSSMQIINGSTYMLAATIAVVIGRFDRSIAVRIVEGTDVAKAVPLSRILQAECGPIVANDIGGACMDTLVGPIDDRIVAAQRIRNGRCKAARIEYQVLWAIQWQRQAKSQPFAYFRHR